MRKKEKTSIAHRVWKILCVIILGIVGVACLGVAVSIGLVHNLLGDIHYDNETSAPTLVWDESNVVEQPDSNIDLSHLEVRGNTSNIKNYFLLGIDSRDGSFYGRSDTMMIVSINDSAKTIKLISLMRDTWARIAGIDWNGDGANDYAKLNAAYSYGGFETLNQTVQDNFCLDIDQYVGVNFDVFCTAVDALGGVDVEVDDRAVSWIPLKDPGNPDKFAKDLYGYQIRTPIGHDAGTYHLAGFQALAYCRVRHAYPNSDFSRQQNQRKVITAILNQVKSSNPVTLYKMCSKIFPQVTTNMDRSEIESYIVNVLKYRNYTIENEYHLPSNGEYSDLNLSGAAGLWLDDPETTVKALHQYIYG